MWKTHMEEWYNFNQSITPSRVFLTFLKLYKCTKSCKASQRLIFKLITVGYLGPLTRNFYRYLYMIDIGIIKYYHIFQVHVYCVCLKNILFHWLNWSGNFIFKNSYGSLPDKNSVATWGIKCTSLYGSFHSSF